MSDQIIARVSQSLAKEQSLESLVRQLLEMLEMVTDMESTYLTKVDVEARLQHIMFARNSQKMHIPENFTVSWDYSLCKRAIDENCFFSDEVPDRWGDCIAARIGNDSNLLIVFYVQIMPDDFVMQLHRF